MKSDVHHLLILGSDNHVWFVLQKQCSYLMFIELKSQYRNLFFFWEDCICIMVICKFWKCVRCRN